MFSYTQKQLEIIINDNTINKEEINQILKNVIEKVEERKTKINTYNNKRYKEQTKDNEPKIRKKPQEEKKTNNMKEYNKLYYELNKEKIKQQLKENRTNNKDKYNEYQKQYYNKKKSITSD